MESEAEARAAQAAAMQARVHPANPLLEHRALVSPAANWRKGEGTCPWCNKPSDELDSGWHSRCLLYYYAARGATHYNWDDKTTPLVEKTPCARCGGIAQEIDHIVSLATARKVGGAEMLQAWTPRNLQWLCVPCRAEKTAEDVQSNSPKGPDAKPLQLSLF